MTQLNRRQWLKTVGLTGAFSMLGGMRALADTSLTEELAFSARLLETPVRLSFNENPYGPSQKVRDAIVKSFEVGCRYPFSFIGELQEMIAKKEGVMPEQVVITAGSTEGLRIAGLTYGVGGGEVISADPTFQSLMNYAENFGAYVHRVPVDKDLMHDLEAMERRVTNKTSLVFVCNPNNPTGTLLPPDRLKDFCVSLAERAIVFVDEAYYDYIYESNYPSGLELVRQGLNVIVSRTFSKVYGLAGIRIGYLIARPDIAARLSKNVMAGPSVPAIFAAKAALEDKTFYQESIQKNQEAKEMIYTTLDHLGLKYHKSHTNFVFFKTGRDISSLNEDMLAQGVQVGRPFPPLLDWCRISTGTIEEVGMFTKALKKVMG